MKSQGSLVSGGVVDAVVSWYSYWPLGAMTGLVVVNLALLAAQKVRQPKGPFLRGQFIKGSGSTVGATIQTLSGKAISDFRRDYNLAVICGFSDPTVDKFEDQRISKSASFPITLADIEIVIPYQPAMTDPMNAAVAELVKQAETKPGFRKSKKGKKVRVGLNLQTWTEAVLLPKKVDPVGIHRLSDVRNLGGKIISEEIDEKRITLTV